MRYPTPLFPIIVSKLFGSGSGSVTPASIVTATGQMDATQKSTTLTNLGAEPQKLIVTITASGGTFSADKTLAELNAARTAGKSIVFKYETFEAPAVYLNNNNYRATLVDLGDTGQKTSVISFFYNGFGVYPAQDGPFADIPISITCTMTSQTGGTWSGVDFTELQAACDNGRPLLATITGIGQMAAFLQPSDSTTVCTSPIVFPDNSIGYVVFGSNNNFLMISVAALVATDTVSGTNVSLHPYNNHVYNCGELTSLTITNPPATGKYTIIFYSGSTPTTVMGIDNFTAEANKRYRIEVEDGYATYDSWPYTPTP